MIDTLLNIIAPHVCVVCGAEGDLLCHDCGKKCISNDTTCFFCDIPVNKGEICEVCKSNYKLTQLTSVGWYDSDLKRAVYAYKFDGKRGGAKPLARLLVSVASIQVDAVVGYIPTTAVHIRERGFDHAKLLAQTFAAQMSLPCIATLARTNNHRQLGSSKKVRQSTIAGTFVPVHAGMYKNKHVVIIEDVITTGSTLREAAQVLLTAGANSVSALVLAKTPARGARPNA